MSAAKTTATLAFGVEPGYAPYRLRQARYWELARDTTRYAQERFVSTGQRTDLLDVGVYDGVSRRYIEAHDGAGHINFHGVDIFPHGRQFVYKHRDWNLHDINLENGLPQLESDAYDVVICEQVLEHLHNIEAVLSDLARVLKPGGLMILGVPIFPHGAHLVRRHLVPVMDRLGERWTGKEKNRGHVQAFSKRSIVRLIRRTTDLSRFRARGFRVISGGVLRPLEHHRWWWQLGRLVGRVVPSLCIEIQITATKWVASGPRVEDQPYVVPFQTAHEELIEGRRAAA